MVNFGSKSGGEEQNSDQNRVNIGLSQTGLCSHRFINWFNCKRNHLDKKKKVHVILCGIIFFLWFSKILAYKY